MENQHLRTTVSLEKKDFPNRNFSIRFFRTLSCIDTHLLICDSGLGFWGTMDSDHHQRLPLDSESPSLPPMTNQLNQPNSSQFWGTEYFLDNCFARKKKHFPNRNFSIRFLRTLSCIDTQLLICESYLVLFSNSTSKTVGNPPPGGRDSGIILWDTGSAWFSTQKREFCWSTRLWRPIKKCDHHQFRLNFTGAQDSPWVGFCNRIRVVRHTESVAISSRTHADIAVIWCM